MLNIIETSQTFRYIFKTFSVAVDDENDAFYDKDLTFVENNQKKGTCKFIQAFFKA